MNTSNTFEFGKYQIYHQNFFGPETKSIILLIHGLGEHIGRYQLLADFMNQYNYGVCGIDLPGHGNSSGQRGHFESLDQVIDLLEFYLDMVRKSHPDAKIILMGHSMGGNILANWLIKRRPNVNAAIFSSPWFGLVTEPSNFRLWLAKTMYAIYKAFPDRTKLDPKGISTLPHEVQKYQNDPLIHDHITPGLFIPIYNASHELATQGHLVTIPALVFHGAKDPITSYKHSERFAHRMPLGNFVLFERSMHEIHYDVERDQLFDTILNWLTSNVKYKLS